MLSSLSLLLILGTAHAGTELSGPVVSSDGFVMLEMTVPIPPGKAREKLADAATLMPLDPRVKTVNITTDEPCEQIAIEGSFKSVAVQTALRRCPSESGFEETLISSSLYSAYTATWQVEPVESGALVRYRVKVEIEGLAPIIINYETGASAAKMMRRVGKTLAAEEGAAE